jgi:hypothetical protein
MTKQEIKGYKLIAEFMGGKEVDWFAERVVILPLEHQKHLGLPAIINKENYRTWANSYILENEIMYKFSWDWLMPVVEKIESLGYVSYIEKMNVNYEQHRVYFNEHGSLLEVARGARNESKLLAVYDAVVDFIEWYNKNKKDER